METISMSAEERTKKIDQFMKLVKEEKLDPFDPDEIESEIMDEVEFELALVRENINKYPTQLLNDLHQEIMRGDTTLSENLITLLGGGNYSIADVHEHFVFRPHLNPDTGFGTMRSLLGALHHYPQLPNMENYAEAPAEDQAKVIALLKVTEAMEEHPLTDRSFEVPLTDVRGMTMLSGEDLIELVLNRPADADRIGRIIVDRKTTDTALITSILDSAAPSLSHGII